MLLIRGQGIRSKGFHRSFHHAEVVGGEGVDADVHGLAHFHKANVLAFDFHLGLQGVIGNDLHHWLTALGHKAHPRGLQIKHNPIDGGADVLVADVDIEFGELAAQIGQFTIELLHGLLQNRQLAQPIYPALGDIAFDFPHLVALLQVLEFGRSAYFLEDLEPIENFFL